MPDLINGSSEDSLFTLNNEQKTPLEQAIADGEKIDTPPSPASLFFSENKDNQTLVYDDVPVLDSDWVNSSFMTSGENLDKEYKYDRFASITDEKFTDTSLGGNIALNPSPQFTRYADPRSGGLLKGRTATGVMNMDGNQGMGRYYGKAIDDNSTNVYFEFGVPKFNNTLFYLFSSVDYKTAVIANSGRSTLFYNIGKGIGLGAIVLAFGFVGIAVILAKQAFSTLSNLTAGPGRFEHYYLKPTMFLYWGTVNSLVTMMATELGILSDLFMPSSKDKKKLGVPLKIQSKELDYIRKMMPGIITTGNALNVQAMVTRAQKLYNIDRVNRLKAIDKLGSLNLTNEEAKLYRLNDGYTLDNPGTDDMWKKLENPVGNDANYSMDDLPLDLSALAEKAKTDKENFDKKEDTTTTGNIDRTGRSEDKEGFVSNAIDTAKAVFDEGARYAVFRVEHIGSSTATFSNSTTSVGLDDKINSAAKGWRDIKFNFGGGKIPGLDTVVNAITNIVVGATDGVTLGLSNVIAGYLAGANINTDKRWDGSTANLPSSSFKMTLRSSSAHPIDQLQNLYIPLASIMAGTLPLSTGHSSSTSPYLCNMFVRGHNRIERGMITQLSITKGVSNLPYNRQRRALAIDVTFTVTDFSDVISVPVPNDLLSSGSVMFDDSSGISRYIQSLCARDLYSTIHIYDKFKIKASRYFQNHGLMMSPEYIGAFAGDKVSGGLIQSVFGSNKVVNYSELY